MDTEFPILESFSKQFKSMLFRRKETIPGSDDLNRIFYLNQGFIRLYTVSKDGSELTLHIFSPSSIFPILWDKKPNSEYYFESLTPVEVYSYGREKLKQFIAEKPAANLEIIRQLTFFSESTIRKLEFKIFGDAYQQVVAIILNLAECFGKVGRGGSTIIAYWFTHQDIASLAGLSRERVTIEINNLQSKKLISYESHFITIPKIELLKEELD